MSTPKNSFIAIVIWYGRESKTDSQTDPFYSPGFVGHGFVVGNAVDPVTAGVAAVDAGEDDTAAGETSAGCGSGGDDEDADFAFWAVVV